VIWLAILALGLGAGTLAGIVGFGASIMLMPLLMLAFGPLEAVPIMAIAGLLANFARVVVWWREIPARRWLLSRGLRIKAWHLALVGAGIGYLSGMVASTGPINTPFFLAYGLVKGAYLSTEALGSIAVGLTKAIVFQRFDALPLETVARGVIVGTSLMIGSRLAKGFVLRLGAHQFHMLMDCLLAGAGFVLLWGAFVLPH
jgi:uncharacterized membrane protein YfcA